MAEYYADYLHEIQQKLNRPFDLHGLHHRHLNRFIQQNVLALPQGAEVLDGGCGMSIWMTPELEARVKYSGVDCQPEAIGFCQRTFPQRRYAVSDLIHLPFPDQQFDAVVMREVIEHLVDLESAVKEICRVLKPGGKYILTTPNYANFLLFLVENIYNRFFTPDLKPYLADVHPSKFKGPQLARLLSNYFQEVRPGTVDLGINLAFVCAGVKH